MSKKDVEHNEEEPKKLDKTKKFIKKHWLPITVGVVCITVTYIVTRRVTLRYLPVEGVSIDFFNKPTHKLVEIAVPTTNVGNNVLNPAERVGFFSQQSAGQAYGVSEPMISNHLHGALPHIQGEILERANFRIFAEVKK